MAALNATSLRYIVDALDRSTSRVEFALDGTILGANANFLELTGYTFHELRGKPHSMLVDEETASSPAYLSFWAKLSSGTFQSGEFQRIDKTGTPFWIQATYNPVFDRRGRQIGVVKFAVDVTERVLQREADREMQQRFTEMVENTSVQLILADREMKIVYMNPASEEELKKLEGLLSCPVDQMIGQPLSVFYPEFTLDQPSPDSPPANLPHQTVIQLGDDFLDLKVTALKDRRGRYMGPLVTWEVVTEKKRAEAREAEQRRLIEERAEDIESKVCLLVDAFTAAS